jgi:4-hydroxy-tetrahydrodipicolinate synthase
MINPQDWEGCFTAVVTPFKKNGDLDTEAFSRNLDLLIREGLDGAVIAGCTGESWMITDQEREDLFELAVEVANNRCVIIGGTGQLTAEENIHFCREAKEWGMDGVMILPPPMVHPNDKEIITFYNAISDTVDIPILVYNNPRRQGVDMPPELLLKLADIKNVVAVKEASKEFGRVFEVIRLIGGKLKIFGGHSSYQGVTTIMMGADGWVGSLDTQLLGEEAILMYKLIKNGEMEEAIRIQYRCIAAELALKGKQSGTFPAGLKYAMNLRGRPGGYPRLPILPLTEEQKAHVREVMKKLELI